MQKLERYLNSLNAVSSVTASDLKNTQLLLEHYAALVRISTLKKPEASDRPAASVLPHLVQDCGPGAVCPYISRRVSNAEQARQLIELMNSALELVRINPRHGELYCKILRARYFSACRSNEEAHVQAGISCSTYYRHIKAAKELYAAMLWNIVVPDAVLAARDMTHQEGKD